MDGDAHTALTVRPHAVTDYVVPLWLACGELLGLEWGESLILPAFQLQCGGEQGAMAPAQGMRHLLEAFEEAGVDGWGALRFLMDHGLARQGELPDLLAEMADWFGHGRPPETDAVDVVDSRDCVIGCLPRPLVHARGLRHRFVQVMVEGADGHLLLQRRSMRKEKGPGLLDASVGGHVDAGETYEVAARREAAEELGLDSGGVFLDMGTITDFSPGVENMVGRLYLHRSDGPFTGWEEEADRIEWVSREELALLAGRFPYLLTGGMLSTARILRAR